MRVNGVSEYFFPCDFFVICFFLFLKNQRTTLKVLNNSFIPYIHLLIFTICMRKTLSNLKSCDCCDYVCGILKILSIIAKDVFVFFSAFCQLVLRFRKTHFCSKSVKTVTHLTGYKYLCYQIEFVVFIMPCMIQLLRYTELINFYYCMRGFTVFELEFS